MKPFVVVDVGARWGVAERWSALGTDVRVFGFDPDEAECERLNELARNTGDLSVTYVPVALGAEASKVVLYSTVEPACSSIYPPIDRLADTFTELACMRAEGRQDIRLSTLDQWCDENDVMYVDVLKLDIQGAELDVFRGASRTLASVQLLEIEVEFNPLYEGQPLFGDVDAFLRTNGFLLWRLDNLVHYSAGGDANAPSDSISYFDSVPVTAPGRGGQLYWGHAYYVRSELCPGSVDPAGDEQRRRSADAAHAAGLVDLAAFLRHA